MGNDRISRRAQVEQINSGVEGFLLLVFGLGGAVNGALRDALALAVVVRGAPVVDGQPSFVLDAEHRAAAGELLRLRHPATEQGLTAMHAALLPWDTSPTRTFLLTVRVSNTSDGGGAKDGRAGSSAVNYALLDAELDGEHGDRAP